MKLWIIKHLNEHYDWWDCSHGFVIRAESESQARQLIVDSHQYGDEGHEIWLDAKRTSCAELSSDGEPAIILRDFYAG